MKTCLTALCSKWRLSFSSHWMWTEVSDLLLKTRIRQIGGSMTSEARPQKTLPLLSCFLSIAHSRASQQSCPEETYTVWGETHVEKKWGLPSTTSTNFPTLQMSHFRRGSSSYNQTFRGWQVCPTFWLQALSKAPSEVLIHRNWVGYLLFVVLS